jgi:hypothetical protein
MFSSPLFSTHVCYLIYDRQKWGEAKHLDFKHKEVALCEKC